MRQYLTLFILVTLSACAWGPEPGEDMLPGLSPLTLGSSAADSASGLASHSSGVYTVGHTSGNLYGTSKGDFDAFISKYDTNGAVLWGRQFGTAGEDSAAGVASDGSNNAYVFGETRGSLAGARGGYDVFLRKYNASGGVGWTRQFGTRANDLPGGVATYGSSAVYVVGVTGGNLAGRTGGNDAFIRKYSSSGSVLWTRQFGVFQDDIARDVAVDGSGNAYVVGYTYGALGAANGGGSDMFIRRYNASGSVAWTKQLHSGGRDFAVGVAVNGGNVYLLGQFDDAPNLTDPDVQVLKYTTSGTPGWNFRFGTSANDYPYDVTADSRGVIVSGSTYGNIGGAQQGNGDGFVYRIASDLSYYGYSQQQGSSEYDSTNAVLLRSGEVYAAGETRGVLGGDNHGGQDAFLRRLTGIFTMETVWTVQ